MVQSLSTRSPHNSCSSWGSGGLGRKLTHRHRLPPCPDSVTHTAVLKYTDVESADTWKQMHSPVSCRLEGSDFTPWPSRLCSTRSACPLGCLILLDLTPSPLPALAALPPSHSCPPPGLCTGNSSTQKTVPLSSFRAQLRMPPLTLWLSRHPISVLAAFLSAIIHV